jgi:serine/threonine-protein kinase RsbW
LNPLERTARISLHREIRSHLAEVDPLCREIRSLLEENGLAWVCFAAELVARECLNNAIVHGNRRDVGKKVALNLLIKRKWIYLQIIDEGLGFNWRRATRAPLPEDTAVSGRGLSISALYADRITFNQRGNQVTVWLKKESKGGTKQHERVHDRT